METNRKMKKERNQWLVNGEKERVDSFILGMLAVSSRLNTKTSFNSSFNDSLSPWSAVSTFPSPFPLFLSPGILCFPSSSTHPRSSFVLAGSFLFFFLRPITASDTSTGVSIIRHAGEITVGRRNEQKFFPIFPLSRGEFASIRARSMNGTYRKKKKKILADGEVGEREDRRRTIGIPEGHFSYCFA